MLCPVCKTPMINKKGSESGEWGGDLYTTSEIKVCRSCGLEILETYSAKVIKDPKNCIKEIKL